MLYFLNIFLSFLSQTNHLASKMASRWCEGRYMFFDPIAPPPFSLAIIFGLNLAQTLILNCWVVLSIKTFSQASSFLYYARTLFSKILWGQGLVSDTPLLCAAFPNAIWTRIQMTIKYCAVLMETYYSDTFSLHKSSKQWITIPLMWLYKFKTVNRRLLSLLDC